MREEDLAAPAQEHHHEDEWEEALRQGGDAPPLPPSLTEEIAGLIADGKTYAEAEIAYQKARIAFAADRGKSAALLGVFALGLVHLALIALVVGAVIALAPLVTPIGATLIVAGVLLGAAVIALVMMQGKTREIGEAFQEDDAPGGQA